LLVTSSIQGVLIIIQTITDQPVGLSIFDAGAELRFIDGLLRSPGTMHHVYEPAALALGAAGLGVITAARIAGPLRWLWAGSMAIAGATVGLTHSRSALLGLILMTPFLVVSVRKNRQPRLIIAPLLIGFTVAALLTSSAWLLRGDQSASGDLDDMSLGRVTLIEQAATMIGDHPLLGVGPGRYLDTMEAEYELDPDYPFIVHNVSLAVAAENGITAAFLVTVLVGWAVVRALWSDRNRAALALSIGGFLVFDVLHYNRPVGLLMTAIWLGTLHVTDRQQRCAGHRRLPTGR
jgi:O-antigen ligase